MSVLGLLRAVAGEAANTSALARWRQAVAEALAPSYVMAHRITSAQALADLANAADVIFNAALASQGGAVSLNTTTGKFTLNAPGWYELEAGVVMSLFNTVATDIAEMRWRDESDTDLGGFARHLPAASTQNLSTQSVAKALIRVDSVPKVVRVVSAEGQGAASVAVGSWASVRRLNAG